MSHNVRIETVSTDLETNAKSIEIGSSYDTALIMVGGFRYKIDVRTSAIEQVRHEITDVSATTFVDTIRAGAGRSLTLWITLPESRSLELTIDLTLGKGTIITETRRTWIDVATGLPAPKRQRTWKDHATGLAVTGTAQAWYEEGGRKIDFLKHADAPLYAHVERDPESGAIVLTETHRNGVCYATDCYNPVTQIHTLHEERIGNKQICIAYADKEGDLLAVYKNQKPVFVRPLGYAKQPLSNHTRA